MKKFDRRVIFALFLGLANMAQVPVGGSPSSLPYPGTNNTAVQSQPNSTTGGPENPFPGTGNAALTQPVNPQTGTFVAPMTPSFVIPTSTPDGPHDINSF